MVNSESEIKNRCIFYFDSDSWKFLDMEKYPTSVSPCIFVVYSFVANHTPYNLIYSEHILSLFFHMSTMLLLISHMQVSAPFLLGKTLDDPDFKWTIYGFSALFEREAIPASSAFDCCGYKWDAL